MAQSAGQTLQQLNAQDISKTFERTLQVFQGNREQFPELLKDAGSFLLQYARKLSRPQLYLAAGIIAVGAVALAIKLADELEEGEVHEING